MKLLLLAADNPFMEAAKPIVELINAAAAQ